jgi:ankyrin repeat protein
MPRTLILFLLAASAAAQQGHAVIDAVHKGHAVGHEQGGVDAVRAALKAGGDVNERDENGWTPLMHAALECRAQIAGLLLERGADVKLRANTGDPPAFVNSGLTALMLASQCFIARRRAQLAPERHMPPEYAAYELAAPAKMVRDLIAHSAAANQADADGRTPLMIAAMHGWPDVARELLAAHAAVNTRDHQGRLAIDYADPADRDMLGLLKDAGSESPTGRSGRDVCDAEKALDRLGYDTPIIDCIAGQQLAAVVRRFQQDHSLPTTGELDPATKRALGIRQVHR